MPKLVELARGRLPQWADRIFLGEALSWDPPRRFDFVRTELCYVRPAREGELLKCAWREPHLVFVWETPQNVHGAIYRLGRGVVPRYFAEHPDEQLPRGQRWMKQDPSPTAAEVLRAAGVDPAVTAAGT